MKTTNSAVLLCIVLSLTLVSCLPPSPTPEPTLTPPPTAIPILPSTAAPLEPALAPTPTDIVPTDRTTGWYPNHSEGSSISIAVVPGMTADGLEISYGLKKDGWVLISRNIDPNILMGVNGIKFFYKGSGALNTIELKLIYEEGTIFSVLWNNATVKDGWELLEIYHSDYRCWTDTPGCLNDLQRLEPEKVSKIDFAISNKPGNDVPGSGKIIIDNVQGIQP